VHLEGTLSSRISLLQADKSLGAGYPNILLTWMLIFFPMDKANKGIEFIDVPVALDRKKVDDTFHH
jgi:hypothetical protein